MNLPDNFPQGTRFYNCGSRERPIPVSCTPDQALLRYDRTNPEPCSPRFFEHEKSAEIDEAQFRTLVARAIAPPRHTPYADA